MASKIHFWALFLEQKAPSIYYIHQLHLKCKEIPHKTSSFFIPIIKNPYSYLFLIRVPGLVLLLSFKLSFSFSEERILSMVAAQILRSFSSTSLSKVNSLRNLSLGIILNKIALSLFPEGK